MSKLRLWLILFFTLLLGVVLIIAVPLARSYVAEQAGPVSLPENGLVFIHHSVGSNWLNDGLHDALLAKSYIDERNDITYGTRLEPDPGRPGSLGDVPGDLTDMHHWILWFNDYLQGIRTYQNVDGIDRYLRRLGITESSGFNRIIMFKSCYPNSNVTSDGDEPGDPFSASKTLANYMAVYRHPDGPGNTYTYNGESYSPLEDIFASNPDVLFIAVTAPPLHYAPSDATNDANAHRARLFNNWLKQEWLPVYNTTHPGLDNVAVFDFFDVLAYPDDHPDHPNRLRAEYGGESGDSHPNTAANVEATTVFAAGENAFLDQMWGVFAGEQTSSVLLPLVSRTQSRIR